MPTHTVKWFSHDMEGAPVLGTNFGDMTNLFDKVLVQGFGSRTVSNIVNSGTVVTVYFSAAHAYKKDQIIELSGANESEYNTQFRITSVGTTMFTFDTVGTMASTPTGTITCKIPSLDFDIAYTGTNKRIYRAKVGTRHWLRVDDAQLTSITDGTTVWPSTYFKFARVTIFGADPVAIDGPTNNGIWPFTTPQAPYVSTDPARNHVMTGTGAALYNGMYRWYYGQTNYYGTYDSTATGSYVYGSTPRDWTIIGDNRGFYICLNTDTVGTSVPSFTTAARGVYSFGEFESNIPGDAYNTMLTASPWYQASNNGNTSHQYANNPYSYNYSTNDNGPCRYSDWCSDSLHGKVLMRNHTGYGGSLAFYFSNLMPYSMGARTNGNQCFHSGVYTSNGYPLGPGYGVQLTPVYIRQATDGLMRGTMPGLLFVMNNVATNNVMLNNEVLDNVSGLPNKKVLCIQTYAGMLTGSSTMQYGRTCFDITGPWH